MSICINIISVSSTSVLAKWTPGAQRSRLFHCCTYHKNSWTLKCGSPLGSKTGTFTKKRTNQNKGTTLARSRHVRTSKWPDSTPGVWKPLAASHLWQLSFLVEVGRGTESMADQCVLLRGEALLPVWQLDIHGSAFTLGFNECKHGFFENDMIFTIAHIEVHRSQ